MDDPLYKLSKHQLDRLMNSWAHTFQEYIFPEIDEERFAVLFSDNEASRPNIPVNITIGKFLLRELFSFSDVELFDQIAFNLQFQYALRTTGYEKQPIGMNSLGNFRNRLVKHYTETGEDLLQPEIKRLSLIMADKLKIDGKKIRMDSFMVSSSCKNLSRIELTYKVNYNFIKILNKLFPDELTITLKEYLKKGHKNDTVYRTRDIDSESKLTFLLKQSAELFNISLDLNSKELISSEEFILLERLLNDQIIKNDNDNDNSNDKNGKKVKIEEVEPKKGKDIKPTSLQNPSDPDATYRTKYGPNIGYVTNITEVFDDDNRIYISYKYKPNIYSDTNFLRDFIEKQNKSKWEIMLLVDGAYYSYELSEKAKEKNIILIPGELAGRKNNDKLPLTEHKIDSSTNEIIECANGKKPEISTYDEEKEAYVAKFNKSDCENCEYASTCTIEEQKNTIN
ncbi:MAG: transposase [Bacillota bacterium]|nr:transposase [Bacillota bacterium]